MANNFTPLLVVAAALQDEEARWMMHCRPAGRDHAGLWEFPGGKVEQGENPRAALVREIEEESGLILCEKDLTEAGFAIGKPGEGHPAGIVICLYSASSWAGSVQAREGGLFKWCTADEILGLNKPPLDVELARQLLQKSL